MKKVLLNWRFWIVMAILIMGIVLFFSEPNEYSNYYIELLVASKIVAFILLIGGTKLLQYYDRSKKIDFEEWDDFYENYK